MPDSKVGILSVFGFITIEKAVLRRFKNLVRADLARKGDPHALQPGANREPAIQGEPDEGANLVGVGAVSNSGQHLGIH